MFDRANKIAVVAPKFLLPLSMLISIGIAHRAVAASEVALSIYENQMRAQCPVASEAEVARLRQCSESAESANLESLDRTAEMLVFTRISSMETERLACLRTRIDDVRTNPELNAFALNEACGKLARLQDSLRNQRFFARQIASYRTSTDRRIRHVSDREFATNTAILRQLEQANAAYVQIEQALRMSDPLLSSPRIYAAVKARLEDGVINSGDSPEAACTFLRSRADRLLQEDSEEVAASRSSIQTRLNSQPSWLDDARFKERLWASGSRDQYLRLFGDDRSFTQSTFCRFEGRYGLGARTRDGLTNLSLFAVGGGLAGMIRGAGVLATSRGVVTATTAARATLAIDIAAGAALTAPGVMAACSSRATLASSDESCAGQSPSDRRSLFYRRMSENNCFRDSLIAAASSSLGIIAGAQVIRAAGREALALEVAERATTTTRMTAGGARGAAEALESLDGQRPSGATPLARTLGREDGAPPVADPPAPAPAPAPAAAPGPAPAAPPSSAAAPPAAVSATGRAQIADENLERLTQANEQASQSFARLRSEIGAMSSLSPEARLAAFAQLDDLERVAEGMFTRLLTNTAERTTTNEQALIAVRALIERRLAETRASLRTPASVPTTLPSSAPTTTSESARSRIAGLVPDQEFALQVRNQPPIQTSMSRDVVRYLQENGGDNPRRFMTALENGVIAQGSNSGIMYLDRAQGVVQVKIRGSGSSSRLIGCFDPATRTLRLVRVFEKSGRGDINPADYAGMCSP